MEHSLSCNNLKCRSPLGQRALVTTCRFVTLPIKTLCMLTGDVFNSHIFCLECAHQLGITRGEQGKRPSCPACKSELPTPEDAIITNLNPSEEYKTSILSGLSPNIVMECAGRALSFWAYQTTQDIYYHQHLYRTLTEKYSNLHQHLEKTMNDANSHIENLHDKMTGSFSGRPLPKTWGSMLTTREEMTAEQDGLRRKVEDISQAYKEKSKRLLQVQELYDKVKRKAEMGHIERAASEAVASTLHTTARQTNESQGGVGYGRNAITGHEGSSFFRMAHLGLPGNTPVVGSSRVEHTRPDSEEQWLEPRLRRQASTHDYTT